MKRTRPSGCQWGKRRLGISILISGAKAQIFSRALKHPLQAKARSPSQGTSRIRTSMTLVPVGPVLSSASSLSKK